jgi:hypothetical protein
MAYSSMQTSFDIFRYGSGRVAPPLRFSGCVPEDKVIAKHR